MFAHIKHFAFPRVVVLIKGSGLSVSACRCPAVCSRFVPPRWR
nr:MAG TPA: hypothetical protein [Caudoviricetes sp.]